jgi:hypothetical protein
VRWVSGELIAASGGRFTLIDLTIDLPQRREGEIAARLTDFVVRVAEALRRPDDVYHLLRREPAGAGPVAVPVGPLVQELGERFSLVLARSSLSFRTALWLVLPAGRALGEVVDAFAYDPEAAGEPEALLSRAGMRWAAASSFGRVGVSTVFRALLWVPESSAPALDALLLGLRASLA